MSDQGNESLHGHGPDGEAANLRADRSPGRFTGLFTGLSSRLLVLTVAFVMLAELLIWTPSIAQYRKAYLEELIARAHLAMIAVGSLATETVEPELAEELLFHTGTYGIVLSLSDQRMLMVGNEMPPQIDLVVDLMDVSMMDWVTAAFSTLAQSENRVLRVMGTVPKNPNIGIEVITDEAPLRAAMIDYSRRILGLSVVISLITAMLVFLSLQWLMVRPVLRMTDCLARFRKNPEDPGGDAINSTRSDEIGVALRELGHMQMQIRSALRQKNRLATLGEAVAKINHDLRNTLATAVLAFDRLATIDDPEVKRLSPKLYKAISRAIELCSQTLEYASAGDLSAKREPFHLSELVSEIAAEMRDAIAERAIAEDTEAAEFHVENRVPFEITVSADRVQLFRALLNLAFNAQQAGATVLTVSCHIDSEDTGDRDGNRGRAVIRLTDDGPGLPPEIVDQIFEPFTTAKTGGTGLGLVIVSDIIAAHQGEIRVASSGPGGVTFEIVLPDAICETVMEEAS